MRVFDDDQRARRRARLDGVEPGADGARAGAERVAGRRCGRRGQVERLAMIAAPCFSLNG
jgi:hypothetical protein